MYIMKDEMNPFLMHQ